MSEPPANDNPQPLHPTIRRRVAIMAAFIVGSFLAIGFALALRMQ